MSHVLSARLWRRLLVPVALAVTVLPVVVLLWLRAHPGQNVAIEAPAQHFFIVTAVSLLALGVAALVTVAALQIQQYRVLFIALGFLSMGGIFAVHALATPGMVMPGMHAEPAAEYAGTSITIVGLSAFLSLLVPALLFGAGCTGLGTPFGWRVPFRPGALLVVVGGALALYAVLALSRSSLFAENPITTETGSHVIAVITGLLFALAAWRQAMAWRTTRQPLQAALALAFVLLIEAQVTMVTTDLWTLAWWTYHLQMLFAVMLALGALLHEYGSGSSLRRILEGALALRGEVGLELENVEAIAALAAATEAKDPDTRGHTVRVAEISVAIGREMGLSHATLRTLARAGLLHDIGKISIPDPILLKPGALTPEEWQVMKRHPERGLDILRRVGNLEREAAILIAHHERMNGSGYPRGLSGEAIPLEARIISVADTYDAVVSDRPYRKGIPRDRALQILLEEKGPHLYPPAVEAFMRIHDKGLLAEQVDGVYRAARPAGASGRGWLPKRRKRESLPLMELVSPSYWERRLAEECVRGERYLREFVVLLVGVSELDEWLRPPSEKAYRAVAEALLRAVRGSDVITRIRADRFAVLLPETPPDVAYPIAARLATLACEHFAAHELAVDPLHVEFGIAAFGPSCRTPDDLLAAAERDLIARSEREAPQAQGRTGSRSA